MVFELSAFIWTWVPGTRWWAIKASFVSWFHNFSMQEVASLQYALYILWALSSDHAMGSLQMKWNRYLKVDNLKWVVAQALWIMWRPIWGAGLARGRAQMLELKNGVLNITSQVQRSIFSSMINYINICVHGCWVNAWLHDMSCSVANKTGIDWLWIAHNVIHCSLYTAPFSL